MVSQTDETSINDVKLANSALAAGTPPSIPLPVKSKTKAAPGSAAPNPCAALTSAAIEAVISEIKRSLGLAESDKTKNENNTYGTAATYNVDTLSDARDRMEVLLAWLYGADVLGIPNNPPSYVSNATGAYNVHGYVRETVTLLHLARHWALVSATWHGSLDAKNSYEATTDALNLIEPLGAEAGRCFMQSFGPYS